jgi:hypothetical protein
METQKLTESGIQKNIKESLKIKKPKCECNMYKLKGECWHVGSYKPTLYEKV